MSELLAQRPAVSDRQTLLAIQEKIEQKDFESASRLIAQAEKRFPSDGGLDNLLGVVEVQQGHTEQARRAFTSAIAHSPRLTGAYLNLGRLLTEKAGTDKQTIASALQVYEKLLRFEPANEEANYEAATLLMASELYQRSLEHIARLSPSARKEISVQLLLCADHAALGHKPEADTAAAAIIADPALTEQDAMEILPALRTARRADLIESIYTAANNLHPLSLAGLRTLGLAQEASGKLDLARATLEHVFTQETSSEVVLVDLTRIAIAAKDYQGALGYLAHARELKPTDASLPYEFGVVCLRLGLLGEARKAMGEAIKLEPENPEYNFGMGTVSSFAQDPTGALPYLEKYHQLRPSDPAGILTLGTTYYRSKNFETAIIWLKQAMANPTTASDAHFYLGRIARQQSRLDDAASELKLADQLSPNRPDILAELGQIAVSTRNYAAAKSYLQRSIELDKDNYAANFALLQLYARTGDEQREAQSKRFDEIKNQDEEQYKEMMRIIEIRPSAGNTP